MTANDCDVSKYRSGRLLCNFLIIFLVLGGRRSGSIYALIIVLEVVVAVSVNVIFCWFDDGIKNDVNVDAIGLLIENDDNGDEIGDCDCDGDDGDSDDGDGDDGDGDNDCSLLYFFLLLITLGLTLILLGLLTLGIILFIIII